MRIDGFSGTLFLEEAFFWKKNESHPTQPQQPKLLLYHVVSNQQPWLEAQEVGQKKKTDLLLQLLLQLLVLFLEIFLQGHPVDSSESNGGDQRIMGTSTSDNIFSSWGTWPDVGEKVNDVNVNMSSRRREIGHHLFCTHISIRKQYISGWWFEPLKNIKVNWDDDINPILMGK